jgi:hypothetical protein
MSLCSIKHHAVRTYVDLGSEGITSHIPNLSTRGKYVVSFTPGKEPHYLLARELSGPLNWSRCCRRKIS